jgi:hypothetical protein
MPDFDAVYTGAYLYGLTKLIYAQGWPEPYMYSVYDRIFGDFPAKNTVYTPYIYGSGQPYLYTMWQL